MAFTTGAKGDALLPISPKTIRTTDAAPLRREREAMFLEVNFRCYLTHSICGSKIMVIFLLFTMRSFSLYRGLHTVAHLGELLRMNGAREFHYAWPRLGR
jgi:hypothetical protein